MVFHQDGRSEMRRQGRRVVTCRPHRFSQRSVMPLFLGAAMALPEKGGGAGAVPAKDFTPGDGA